MSLPIQFLKDKLEIGTLCLYMNHWLQMMVLARTKREEKRE
jgi:hypothetical protein